VLRKKAIVKAITISSRTSGINSNACQETGTCPTIMKITITTDVRDRFMRPEQSDDRIMIYFGKLILRIRSPLPTMAVTLPEVTSTKKFQNSKPKSRYTG